MYREKLDINSSHYIKSKFQNATSILNVTYPLDIPPPAEKPPLGRSTTFITISTLPVSVT